MKEIVITHIGSPENEKEVEEFLFNIFNDPDMVGLSLPAWLSKFSSFLRKKKTISKYRRIENNPCTKYTAELSEKLSTLFKDDGYSVKLRFTHISPYIYSDFVRGSVVFPLYPQFSKATIGIIKRKLENVHILKEWYYEEEFLKLMQNRISAVLKEINPNTSTLLFLAHSIPYRLVQKGDDYERQVIRTYEMLKERFPAYRSELAYVGKVGFGKWLEPDAIRLVKKINSENVVSIYLSFPIDNLEVLYDVDIKLKEAFIKNGVRKFIRVPLLNSDDDFVYALYNIIKRRI